MSLKDAYTHIKQAEQKLSALIEQEEQLAKLDTEKPLMYTFVYEMLFDTGEWCPSSQDVEAHSIKEAFCTFGNFLHVTNAKVRNIRYGLYSEMEQELDEIREWWRKQREEKAK